MRNASGQARLGREPELFMETQYTELFQARSTRSTHVGLTGLDHRSAHRLFDHSSRELSVVTKQKKKIEGEPRIPDHVWRAKRAKSGRGSEDLSKEKKEGDLTCEIDSAQPTPENNLLREGTKSTQGGLVDCWITHIKAGHPK